jgi:HEAT repeat protein
MKVFLSLVLLLGLFAPAQAQARRGPTVEELVAKLRDKNQEVAAEAIDALVARGEGAVPALESLLQSEKNAVVALRAAATLLEIRPEHPALVAGLLRVAKGRGTFDSEETLMARRTAGMLLAGTPAGIRELPALLKDKDVFVRRSAAFALDDPTEAIGSLSPAQLEAIGEVLPALVAAVDDKDEVVSGMSCEVLGQIVRSKTEPLSSKAERLLQQAGQSRGDCLCGCD